ncbi:tRNA CCA-pyrophosphorylase [Paucilactobacillus hokkaidonensis JCM 18461]|uniref:CCA-adding enzyme n=2 Tax=Paucilactobacillus hokkaidonensis TaxID=1193095 RepID=A0A0A1GUN8_9LACO|nr:CCA tRNA nucleotidyltransferase [Paucilactobacillus hokkaidonensis]KRO10683.1 poly A polymerase [Paucilactobacillus hokkaidonensis]BAP85675.1 tRNA CCA-pyrophosphorylase [Paucilactobacillus hokkaidonensis JCM 18461]
MIIKKLPEEFEQARPIMQKIEAAGFEAYFVGGSVRDTILGNTIHDVDIASSAYPNEIKQIFNRTVDTGIEHGTVMVLEHGEGYEITTFRTESGYQDFRRPDSVTFVRSLTEDLQRRDFTINALAMRENGEIIDLFSGLKDLKNGVIKAVGDPQQRFHEDALRMMRAARFASQLDFTIEAKTMAGIKANASLLTKIAVERIRVELEKLFLGQNPTSGIEVFVNTKLYQYCPMLAPFEIDLRQLATLEKWDLSLPSEVWALLAYTFYLHGKQINQFLKAWKTSNQVIIDTVQVVAAINEISEEVLTAKMLYQTGKERLISANKIALLFGGELTTDDILKRYDELPIKHKNELELNGKQLLQEANLRPGPIIGKILQRLEQDVVENKIENRHDLLIEAAKEMVKEG